MPPLANPFRPHRIDVHHHVVPPFYRQWLDARGIDAGGLPIPDWTPEDDAAFSRRAGVATSILSVSTPGAEPVSGREAASLARDLNAYCHELVRSHPQRYGYFAMLTLPDVDSAVTELHHAYDELGADGVILFANSKGTYLGDPLFEPLMAELDERRAVVLVHPQELPGPTVPGIAPYVADFLLDTTRAAVNLGRHGVIDRYPGIRWILSHGGGFVPYAAFRLATFASPRQDALDGLRILRRFYVDTALTPSPFSMPSLLRFVPRDRVLFGSDYPYAPAKAALLLGRALSAYPTTRHHAIDRGNAERLFPRLAGGR